jgi:hypothetical protein
VRACAMGRADTRVGRTVGSFFPDLSGVLADMPHKFNAERRHRIPKMQPEVTNWAEYESGLCRRAGLALCVTEEAIDGWSAAPRSTPGGQATYSDSAIQTSLVLRTAFKLPLRQTEDPMTSVVELLGCELAVLDHTTVSRRPMNLPSIARAALPEGPLHVAIDSTGLKVVVGTAI